MLEEARTIELIVVGVYLLAMLAIGLLTMRSAGRSSADFLAAGQSVKLPLQSFAYLAGIISGAAYLGFPGLAYSQGAPLAAGIVFGVMSGIFLNTVLLAGPLRRLDALTYPDFIYALYRHNGARVTAAIFWALVAFLYLIPQLTGGAVTATFLLGVPQTIGLLAFGLILVVYAGLGGFWAVTWSDAIQGGLLLLTMILTGIMIAMMLGTGSLWSEVRQVEPEFFASPGWLPVLGAFITWTFALMGQPSMVARLLSSDSGATAQWSGVIGNLLYAVLNLIGVGLVAAAAIVIAGPGIENPDEALLHVLDELYNPVFVGIIAAAVAAAIMSHADTFLVVATSVVVHDFYKHRRPHTSERRLAQLSRIVLVVIGTLAILGALWPPGLILEAATVVAGLMASAFFFPVVFGIWWKRADGAGAVAGMVGGASAYVMLFLYGALPEFSEVLIALIVSASLVVMVSLRTPSEAWREELVAKLSSESSS